MHTAISGQYFYKNRTLKSVNFFNSEASDSSVCVYEVFRVEDSVPLFIEDHLKRLKNSANIANIELWKTSSQIKQVIKTLIAANNSDDGNIKLDFKINSNSEREFQAYFLPSHYPSETEYKKGVVACFQQAERPNPTAKIFNSKVRGQANSIIEKEHVYETILVDHLDHITEGSRSNLFFIKDEQFFTAPDEVVLPGVIRKKVLEIIEMKGWNIQFKSLHKDELSTMDAAFLTGTSPRVLPLNNINSIKFNVEHPLLQELKSSLNLMINEYKSSRINS
ncbi:aminotransferase class IV [Carboxylicivirga caseinilyticus]|uniref:aminotransferase class IV n=1 Tax=Carboxylicivirga caseinilyticus TaxID=3417572 RepID=UPI003D34B3B6|nr:aminotransferase class IV [Marinilabiliaceae bacterium A049]